eukprot:COSAG01_NODE_578_length_15259_cov_10.160950_5_plen_198_part_00
MMRLPAPLVSLCSQGSRSWCARLLGCRRGWGWRALCSRCGTAYLHASSKRGQLSFPHHECGKPLPELHDRTQNVVPLLCAWAASSSYLTAPPSPRTLPSSRGRSSRCCGWRCPYRCSAGCRLPWVRPAGTAARTGSWLRTPGRKVRVCPVCPAVSARAPEEEEVLAVGSPALSTHASVGEGLEPTCRRCGGSAEGGG